jgi:hypothetical protein
VVNYFGQVPKRRKSDWVHVRRRPTQARLVLQDVRAAEHHNWDVRYLRLGGIRARIRGLLSRRDVVLRVVRVLGLVEPTRTVNQYRLT